MANNIGKDKFEGTKWGSSTGGVDLKTGYTGTKAKHDGLRGVPPKINGKQEIVCKDQDEVDYIENLGGAPHKYKAVLAESEEKIDEEGDDN